MYKILLENRAERDLDALDSSVRERVIERLYALSKDPRRGAKKLTDSGNAWRVRVGQWRVVFEIYDRKREVKIYKIKHRSGAY